MTPSLQRSLLAASAGAIGYGGWAYLVNQSAGVLMGARAGLIQGSYSFALTLGMTLVTERLYHRLPESHAGLSTIVIVSATTWCVAFSIHFANGTPMIVPTILPGFIIGIIYTAVYVAALRKGNMRLPEPPIAHSVVK